MISGELEDESMAKLSADLIRVPNRTCLVTLTDSRGIRRSVEVTADSLFEAGVLAVSAFRESSSRPRIAIGDRVREPSVKHAVTLRQLFARAVISVVRPSFRQHAK